jgi:hypothetical protein
MYVKIMQTHQEGDDIAEHVYEENMFECTNYAYNELSTNETLFTIIHGEDDATTFEINKSNTKIFIMNNSGATIDSYRWTADGKLR